MSSSEAMSEMEEKVARAIWAERVRHAREANGIDLEPYDTDWGGMPIAEQNNILGEARAAIEAMDGWSADFSLAPHDTALWVYATDDQGYAYGPASIWDNGNPNGPELVWNFDRKHRPVNDGVERALMWHLAPQCPGEAKLQATLRASLTEGE